MDSKKSSLTAAEYIGLIIGASTLTLERWASLPMERRVKGLVYACSRLGLTFEQVDPAVFSNAVRSLLEGDADYLRAIIEGFDDV